MENNSFDTNNSWEALLRLLSLIAFASFCILIFIPIRPTIIKYLRKSTYDLTELNKRSLTRSRDESNNWDKVEDGIHVKTGMVFDSNFKYIQAHCLACHSSKLIIQNRADRAGWKAMIKWMQKTQGLHNLTDSEPKILDYLSAHYAPKEMGRRSNVDIDKIEWYILEALN